MFVKGAALTSAALATSKLHALAPEAAPRAGITADDETYWARIASQYDVTKNVIQLENGNWGMMARPVLDAYKVHLDRVNRDTSYYSRRQFWPDAMAIRARVAETLGVVPEEIVFTRNATEALEALIYGYRGLGPDNAVLLADLDYDSMQNALIGHARRQGARIARIDLPEPATHANVIAAYEAAFDANPDLKLVLLTHLSHRTGLVIPVREIVAAARARGIDAIVDAAHSWGQLDITLPELGADFVGLNLHKWIGAPLGVGAAYIRKSRLSAIAPDPTNGEGGEDRIDSRVHTGTTDFAALLSVNDALDFRQSIGGAPMEKRLQYLRDRWVSATRDIAGLQVLTPDDPRMHGAITSFRFAGKTSVKDNIAIAKALLDRHRIFTVHRDGIAGGACVRITPALHNSPEDVDAAATALHELAGNLPV
ncbi:aminotransferase class V-fold PLP-dependent enzyme [Altererythrobacter endophyticus]|uniref:Aminotransferase class V-fold PLP-dependent enzyme n=2 Tax=Altericroceibacterium endophyticum TaxID=1808508 RepID=A0A6I4TA36_9SPHN|nr:aminotransferase class V-fold PLP-dependent enzyme [Altericroceibacterium endophyticum]